MGEGIGKFINEAAQAGSDAMDKSKIVQQLRRGQGMAKADLAVPIKTPRWHEEFGNRQDPFVSVEDEEARARLDSAEETMYRDSWEVFNAYVAHNNAADIAANCARENIASALESTGYDLINLQNRVKERVGTSAEGDKLDNADLERHGKTIAKLEEALAIKNG